jgi:hypothetical protein
MEGVLSPDAAEMTLRGRRLEGVLRECKAVLRGWIEGRMKEMVRHQKHLEQVLVLRNKPLNV